MVLLTTAFPPVAEDVLTSGYLDARLHSSMSRNQWGYIVSRCVCVESYLALTKWAGCTFLFNDSRNRACLYFTLHNGYGRRLAFTGAQILLLRVLPQVHKSVTVLEAIGCLLSVTLLCFLPTITKKGMPYLAPAKPDAGIWNNFWQKYHYINLIMDKKLQGQVAIVTGSSSGIGEGVAKALGAAGAIVVVNYTHDSSRNEAEDVKRVIEQGNSQAIVVQADVSKEEEVQQLFAQTIRQFGTVDILINNSGIQKDASFHEMTLDQWNAVIGVNLTGQFLCAREAIREFLRRGVDEKRSVAAGKIICMSSVHDVIPWAGHANYAASKGGINMLMKTIAQEYAPKKIRINSICPGAIQTPINKAAWETPEALKELLTLIPYGRIGQPEDVGKLAVWLCSDDSDYVTGANHYIDGGMTLYPGFADNG